MALTEIKATKGERVVTCGYDFGDDLDQMVAKFGKEVVFSNAKGSFVITAQAAMRRGIDGSKTDEEIAGIVAGWKPGVAMTRVIDPVAALLGQWGNFTEEKKKEIMSKLRAK